MMGLIANNIIRFVLLLILQASVFNEIDLGVYAHIYLYLLFILLLPIDLPGWILLPVCFILGLMVDISLNTAGLHTSTATLTAFVRPLVLRLLKPREGYELNQTPNLFTMGFNWFVSYTTILVTVHHVWLFTLETFHFSDTFFILLKIMASALLNVVLLLLTEVLTAQFAKAR